MTAGNNGTNKPEDDDPFGYLYEDGRAAGATPPGTGGGYGYPGPASQPGVPRTSYNQVRTVGERQYGQQQYGQQVPPQQQQQQQYGQQNYSQPNAHYAAPEQQPGGAPTGRIPAQRGGGGRGPNTKGLLIGAVAVVAVVVIGIGAALAFGGNDDKDKGSEAGATGGGSSDSGSAEPSKDPTKDPAKPAALPKQDAASLKLSGVSTDKTIPGARSASGAYVPLNTPGSSVTWSVKAPKAGAYTLSINYGVPGKDAKMSLAVNGKDSGRKLNLSNFAKAEEGAADKGWTNTFAYVDLTEGENTFVISCGDGDSCDVNLDQVELIKGRIT